MPEPLTPRAGDKVAAPTPPKAAEEVLRHLVAGKTTQQTADLTGWPRNRVVAVINGTKGWLLDPNTDQIYQPGRQGRTAPTVPFQKPAKPAHAATTAHPAVAEETTTVLPVHAIEPHPANIRAQLGDLTELADSIRAHNILQPLVVARHPSRPSGYQLLAGHRRMAAAQLAGLTAVPVVIRGDVDAGTAIELMLIENCHREGLTPMEKAEAFGKLRNCGLSQTQIAKRTGFHLASVNHYLALLDLDEASQEKVRSGELKVGDAIAAVRATRQKARKQEGRTADWTWEPEYLAKTHPLAKKAKKLCEAREHTMRRRIGKTACGQCWETVIRADEQVVMRASANLQNGA